MTREQWEAVATDCDRVRIPGGWLVRFYDWRLNERQGAYEPVIVWGTFVPLAGNEAWEKEKDEPAGTCTKCGGPVVHRPGKPGEFDHDWNGCDTHSTKPDNLMGVNEAIRFRRQAVYSDNEE